MNEPPVIKKLDEAVINRIAAGEVIQRPANALKELIENSLDAKSTNIQVTVKNGGLKLLQIQDDGTGIRKEDFNIVCERFTTSKLTEFEDLHKISTYGFRGEALASISHIAHLSITSKTKNDVCAYEANFVDGKLQGNPKAIAGNQGTIITVEDLFYNMNVRRTVLRSPAEEYQKIADVVSKYAIHNATVGFALKKAGENNDVRTPPNSTQIENIRIIYGNNIARELIEFKMENEQYKFKSHGFITNANYSTKKFQFLLFINHRLVDCQNLRRYLDQVYSTYLPKNAHPFVYLSLELDPNLIDVNVHPTKHEVHFLNEEQIIETISSELEAKLLGSNKSRVFYTQAKLPGVIIETKESLQDKDKPTNKSINPKEFVRTDCKIQKIEKFFGAPVVKKDHDKIDQSLTEEEFEKYNSSLLRKADDLENDSEFGKNIVIDETPKSDSKTIIKKKDDKNVLSSAFIAKITRVETELTSILELRKDVEKKCHRLLRETFAQHVFVGAIDPTQSLIQFSTKLFLCNTQKILTELFYQFILYNFQNFDSITFDNPLSLFSLAMIALDQPEAGWTEEDGEKNELAGKVVEILAEKKEMLNEYFSLTIDGDGKLKSIPILLENYRPDLSYLPMYILRLATEVNWETEKECFHDFSMETAKFYSQISDDLSEDGKDWKWVTEHLLYPSIKEYFIPPKSFTENAAILEIASLPNLYKVFERC